MTTSNNGQNNPKGQIGSSLASRNLNDSITTSLEEPFASVVSSTTASAQSTASTSLYPTRRSAITKRNSNASRNGMMTDGKSTTPCRFFLNGYCRMGDKCKFSHDVIMEEFGDTITNPENNYNTEPNHAVRQCIPCKTPSPDLEEKKMKGDEKGNPKEEEETATATKLEPSNQSCGICFENIVESKKRFGLLLNCSHVFCLDCIMTWRESYKKRSTTTATPVTANGNPDITTTTTTTAAAAVPTNTNNHDNLFRPITLQNPPDPRDFLLEEIFNSMQNEALRNATPKQSTTHSCPICRVESKHVIPCETFLADKEKEEYFETYKEKKSKIKCKRFDGTLGSCPFGKECYYAHLDSQGRDVKESDFKRRELNNNRRSRYQRQLRRRRRRRARMMMEAFHEDMMMIEHFDTYQIFLHLAELGLVDGVNFENGRLDFPVESDDDNGDLDQENGDNDNEFNDNENDDFNFSDFRVVDFGRGIRIRSRDNEDDHSGYGDILPLMPRYGEEHGEEHDEEHDEDNSHNDEIYEDGDYSDMPPLISRRDEEHDEHDEDNSHNDEIDEDSDYDDMPPLVSRHEDEDDEVDSDSDYDDMPSLIQRYDEEEDETSEDDDDNEINDNSSCASMPSLMERDDEDSSDDESYSD